MAQLVDEVLKRGIGLLDEREVLVHLGIRDAVDGVLHALVGRQGIRVVAGMVLHRHVEDELRIAVGVQQLQDLLVGGAVRHHAAQLIGALEVVDGEELVEAELAVDVLAVPVGGVVGVHGGGVVAQLLELRRQVLGLREVVDGVGVDTAAQVGHGVAGKVLELRVGRAATVRAYVQHAALEAVGEALEVDRSLVVGVQVLVDGEVGEGLVHDGDDGGLLLVELLLGGSALLRGTLARIVLGRVLVDQLLGIVHIVVSGLLGDDGLRRRDEARQEALAVVALERAPAVHLDPERVVVVDERHMGGQAGEQRHAHEDVGGQAAARRAGAVGALGGGGLGGIDDWGLGGVAGRYGLRLAVHRGHLGGQGGIRAELTQRARKLAQPGGDDGEHGAVEAERVQLVHIARAHGHSSAERREVAGLDGHGLEGDDEVLGETQDVKGHGDDRRSGTATL